MGQGRIGGVEDGDAALRRARSAAQLLDGVTGRAPADVARRLLGVQAQDLAWARLALRARGVARAREVDRALTEDRSLVLGWLMRGTLHLVAAEDYGWLLALTAPGRVAGNLRRLGQEGVSPTDAERALEIIRTAVHAEGPLTRAALAERVGRANIRTQGQAMPHLLLYAALRGTIVAGPLHNGHTAYADTTTWLNPPSPPTTEEDERGLALACLARRYLAGHGPATERDLAAWSGLPLRDARAGLSAIAAETTRDPNGLIRLTGHTPAPPGSSEPSLPDPSQPSLPDPSAPSPRLLPAYDPYLLGWHDRGFAVPAAYAKRVHPGGGTLRAVATDRGEAVATWSIRRGATGPQVVLEPFAPLPAATADALEAEAIAIHLFETPP